MLNMLSMVMILMLITSFIFLINLNISKKKINDREKASPFECGFDPLSSARLPFSMQFYMISIIFLIFDIEILIFLPMINSFLYNKVSTWIKTILLFTITLLIGLYVEWNDGALKWLK